MRSARVDRPSFRKATPFFATNDMRRAIAFYTEVLGFTVDTVDPEDDPTLCILDNGDVSIIFDATLWHDPPKLTGQIVFDVDSVDEILERVRPHAKILWGPQTFEYGRREFSCVDPHGYALVFSEPT